MSLKNHGKVVDMYKGVGSC